MSAVAGTVPTEAPVKVALLGVDEASAAVLVDCFRQFDIHAVSLAAHETFGVAQSYSACVLPLDAQAEPVLKAVREAGRGTVIFGLCGSVREAMRFSKWGINAVFHTPVAKAEALQVVRATHLLVTQALRKHVRVPLVCAVTLQTGTQELQATTQEISAGGMSLMTEGPLTVPQAVLAKFELPGMGLVEVQSVVCWMHKQDGTAAIRFDSADPRRMSIRRWIDEYLGD
jgi:hypothetical protein